ncbi:MAG: hypothetical protein QXK24_08195, partial [Ignisphaera sp.]
MNSIFTVAIPMKTLIITVAIPLAVFAVLITVLVLPIVLLKIEISQDVLVVRAPPLYKFTVKHNEIIEISLVNLSSLGIEEDFLKRKSLSKGRRREERK